MERQYVYAIVEQGDHDDYVVDICKVAVEDKDKFIKFCELDNELDMVAWVPSVEIVAINLWRWEPIKIPQNYQRRQLGELNRLDLTKVIIAGANEYYAIKSDDKHSPLYYKTMVDKLVEATKIEFSV